MEKIYKLLNHLVNEESIQEDLNEDYRMLRANQISGSLYPLLKDQEDLNHGFKSDYYQYIRHDEIQMQLIEEVRNIFNVASIDFIFLKGSFLKTLYPKTYMRVMGDIDILVRPESMDKVHKVLEANNFNNWSNSTNHDCFMKNKINIEIHPKLDSDISDEYGDLFLKPWSYARSKDKHEYLLDIEYRFFYQLYHMIKHLYHSGVGLRTLVDLYYLLKNIDINSKKYQDIYHIFPKKEFVNFIISIIYNIFTDLRLLDNKTYDKINENLRNKFVEYIIHSGMHGIGDEHNLFIGGMASSHSKKELIIFTKIKFLFSKTFLKFETMKGFYPYLKKYPFLLPVAYLQRIFKLLFKKSSRHKLTRLSANKNDIKYVEDLFENIGIK
jgi:hypothetical protein